MKRIRLPRISRKPIPFLVLVLLLSTVSFFQHRNGSAQIASSSHKNTASVQKSDYTKPEFAEVSRVVDGDTIEVVFSEDSLSLNTNLKPVEKVRLIGVNAPESVDPRRPVECMGKESSQYLKSILEGTKVILSSDYTQSQRDKYGRLLRYVFIPENNNTFVNQKIIEDGYAYEYTYKNTYMYQKDFKQSQKIAKSKKVGLWNINNCPVNK